MPVNATDQEPEIAAGATVWFTFADCDLRFDSVAFQTFVGRVPTLPAPYDAYAELPGVATLMLASIGCHDDGTAIIAGIRIDPPARQNDSRPAYLAVHAWSASESFVENLNSAGWPASAALMGTNSQNSCYAGTDGLPGQRAYAQCLVTGDLPVQGPPTPTGSDGSIWYWPHDGQECVAELRLTSSMAKHHAVVHAETGPLVSTMYTTDAFGNGLHGTGSGTLGPAQCSL